MAITLNKEYRFINKEYSKMALNVYGTSSVVNGKNVCLYDKDEDPDDEMQRWKYQYDSGYGNRLHCMKNKDYVLDRSSGMTNSCANNAHTYKGTSTSAAESAITFVAVSGETDVYKIRLTNRINNEFLFLTAANNNGTLPASAVTSSTLTTANKNVYWATEATSGAAHRKQCWEAKEYSSGGSSGGGETYQKLIMPINQSVITVCYKENAPAYHEQGFSDPMHYAIDMTGTPRNFYASGNGTIVGYSTTNSGPLGKWLAVRYDKVEGADGKKYDGLVLRYCHLDDIYKTSGEVHINDKNAMAKYGNTGTEFAHLHVEVDTDTVNYNKTPTLKGKSNGLVPAGNNDTTIDPFLVFYKKISEPENQSVSWSQSYCDKDNCSICAQYTQYEPGKVPYVNIEQCRNVPEIS